MRPNFVLPAIAALLLAGCDTMVAPRYSVMADNNVALKALGTSGIGVGEFTGPDRFDNNCRLMGPLEVPDGLTHTQYIRRAFEEELQLAGIYAGAAPRVMLSGRVGYMDFSSTREVTRGTWTIQLTLASSNGMTMEANESYDFASGFIANTACKQTAEAFAPAVQNLIGKFVRAPEFALMVRADGKAAASSDAETDAEVVFWESVRASSDPADLRASLEQYPNGKFAALARNRLAALARKPSTGSKPK
jgi:hypothetical protein